MSFDGLDRYRGIVDDWDAFLDALSRPLPRCGWVNTLKISRQELFARFERQGIRIRPLEWAENAFVFEGPEADAPGRLLEFYLGYFQIQEEAALVPAKFVKGTQVLDLCAAPGNKTAQIALGLEGRGTVVANDRSYQRMRAIRNTTDRLGLTNVVMSHYDAANYPSATQFDTVVADVPCTCEGTSRKNPDALEPDDPERLERLGRTQKAILRKACRLAKPGGRVIYSTCTYAVEENERLVDEVVRKLPFEPIWVDCKVPGFRSAPGLTSHEGQTFVAGLSHAMRVWPHHNDTGGFFVAVFDKPEEW